VIGCFWRLINGYTGAILGAIVGLDLFARLLDAIDPNHSLPLQTNRVVILFVLGASIALGAAIFHFVGLYLRRRFIAPKPDKHQQEPPQPNPPPIAHP